MRNNQLMPSVSAGGGSEMPDPTVIGDPFGMRAQKQSKLAKVSGDSTLFMFSGQGSHYFEMGQTSFENDSKFREWMLNLDEIVRNRLGYSAIEFLYRSGHRKMDPFDRILRSHPAIFMVEYAMAQSLLSQAIRPDIVLASSMGAFAAAAFAGYLDVEDALHLVIDQAEIFEQVCPEGGMLAVLADLNVYRQTGIDAMCELAGQNSPAHFVVAAPSQALAEVASILRAKQITYQRLPVSFAFHSRWIADAGLPMLRKLEGLKLHKGVIPLACCAYYDVLDALPRDYFWTICRQPIEFQRMLTRLESSGAHRYIDVGPSGTLATLAKYAVAPTSQSIMLPTMSPFGNDTERLSRLHAKVLQHAMSP